MQWYIAENGIAKQIPEEVLIYKIQNGEIASNTLVVNAEIKNWIPLESTDIWRSYPHPSVVSSAENAAPQQKQPCINSQPTVYNVPQQSRKASSGKYSFLQYGEEVIMEGAANMQQFLGVNKGGKLILTNRRLIFTAHSFNAGSKFDEIDFSQIALTGNTLNIFVPTPNMIKVVTKAGKTYQFVVRGKEKEIWKAEIARLVQNYNCGLR